MKILCIGDNVLDCYVDKKIGYPGGDAVNVAVHAKRCGADYVEYLGVFGSDDEAKHIENAIRNENVEMNYCRYLNAISGHPGVTINSSGDRIFVGGPRSTAQTLVRIQLTLEELQYMHTFSVCHTTCYSMLEHELPFIKNVPVSFDFSTIMNTSYIKKVAPFIHIAFFSGTDCTEFEKERAIKLCHSLGCEYVVITLGEKGSLLSDGTTTIYQTAFSVATVDTMGAGDSFIAMFLVSFFSGIDKKASLMAASKYAAKTCEYNGAFGYPYQLPNDYVSKIDPVRELFGEEN